MREGAAVLVPPGSREADWGALGVTAPGVPVAPPPKLAVATDAVAAALPECAALRVAHSVTVALPVPDTVTEPETEGEAVPLPETQPDAELELEPNMDPEGEPLPL